MTKIATLSFLARAVLPAVLAAAHPGGVSAWAQTANADELCEATGPMSPTRLLRRLSLDLRGRAPTYEELVHTRDRGSLPEGTVNEWLDTAEFIAVMRRHHEELLWPNLNQVEFLPQNHVLYPYPRDGDVIYMSPLRSVFHRASGPGYLYEPCLNEPARFDDQGRLIMEPLVVAGETVAYLDGYVVVEPYWAPGTTVKVCALEALDREASPVCPNAPERFPFVEPICANFARTAQRFSIPFRGENVDCEGPLATLAPGCGCGSDLRRCQTPETLARLRHDFNDQALRIVERVIREGRPYHDILTTKTIEVSGPIAHYLQHQSRLSFDLFADPDPSAPMETIDLAFIDTQWVDLERTGRHSGVLTSPAYLLRHAVWRQRAHRFYNAFECESFEPSGPLPSPYAECSQRQDLTERCGCADCHQTLEPMASYWGRFAEYGFMSLTEERFPKIGLAQCRAPFESVEQLFLCSRLYELQPVGEEAAYTGYLNSYVFRSPAEERNIEEGPRQLVEASLASGQLASCTVERMWTRFMHREPSTDERFTILPGLTERFIASNYDLRTLVQELVEHPAYGRAP